MDLLHSPSVDTPAPRDQNDAAHTIFTQQWAIYRRFVDADYLSHRAFFGILHDLVAARRQAFSFLDLASGDAFCSVRALAGTAIADYTAVDLSEQALELAAKNAASLGCDSRVIAGDFRDYLEVAPRTWDVILIGFSLHHLIGDDKLSFARKIRSCGRPRGRVDLLRAYPVWWGVALPAISSDGRIASIDIGRASPWRKRR